MAFVKSATGDYTLGFAFLALTAIIALVVLQFMNRSGARRLSVAPMGQTRSAEDRPPPRAGRGEGHAAAISAGEALGRARALAPRPAAEWVPLDRPGGAAAWRPPSSRGSTCPRRTARPWTAGRCAPPSRRAPAGEVGRARPGTRRCAAPRPRRGLPHLDRRPAARRRRCRAAARGRRRGGRASRRGRAPRGRGPTSAGGGRTSVRGGRCSAPGQAVAAHEVAVVAAAAATPEPSAGGVPGWRSRRRATSWSRPAARCRRGPWSSRTSSASPPRPRPPAPWCADRPTRPTTHRDASLTLRGPARAARRRPDVLVTVGGISVGSARPRRPGARGARSPLGAARRGDAPGTSRGPGRARPDRRPRPARQPRGRGGLLPPPRPRAPAGRAEDWSHSAPLLAPVPRRERVTAFVRCTEEADGLRPLERQGSAQLSSLAGATALAWIEPGTGVAPPGAPFW